MSLLTQAMIFEKYGPRHAHSLTGEEMKLNIEELAREAGFVQIMRHKDGSSTVLPTPMFERFARLIVERCAQECENISDDYHRREGFKYPEMKTDAQTGASECESAIRQLLED